MAVHQLHPLTDPRWTEFLDRHPLASAFHAPAWLQALERTYGYEPVVYTTCGSGQALTSGIPFCRVRSWITGRRLVSLPFSDHCQPLVDDAAQFEEILEALARERDRGLRYVELRPLRPLRPPATRVGVPTKFAQGESFYFHSLDLRPSEEDLFRGFHKTSVQQRIRRAPREGLIFEAGVGEDFLSRFYQLLMLTRRRHQIPPQPIEWFRNLIECMGKRARIRIASKDGKPVASVLTLTYKQTLMYKYGCSDAEHSKLGGTLALLWEAIQEARGEGATLFDLGRSDKDNEGLVSFKDRWGAARTEIAYLRYPPPRAEARATGLPMRLAKAVFSSLPDPLLVFAGRALYRHRG